MTHKAKKGRKKSDNPKKTWLKVRVTDEMYAMLKEANKSQMINDGLAILMPTLGQKWDGEKWQQWEHEGTAANLVAHKAICYAIETIIDNRFKILEAYRAKAKEGDPYYPTKFFGNSETELLGLLEKQKKELESHSTFCKV
jgi:beta-xylosidase